jgi:hypothetical protein
VFTTTVELFARHVLTRPKPLNAKDEYLGYEEKKRRAAERVSVLSVFVFCAVQFISDRA